MAAEFPLDGTTLRRIVDAVPQSVVVTDLRGTIRLWNHSAERLLGWTEAEVLNTSIFDLLVRGLPRQDQRSMLDALLAGEQMRTEEEVRRPDGTTVHVYTSTRALVDADGQVELFVGASDDLAELSAVEHQAAALNDHLRLALDAGGLGTWRWDLATGITEWDPEMERLFGLEPGTFDGTFEGWQELLHPEDRADVLRVVDDAVERKGQYRLAHRIITPSGEVRWIEGAGRVTLDEDGNVTGTIGCSHDISERAESEQAREQFNELAVDSLARERVQRERLELVVAVNDALEDAEDLPDLLRGVATAVVPLLGDWCVLIVFEDEQSTEPLIEVNHHDPEMIQFAQELIDQHPYDPDALAGLPAVIRTGEPEFFPLIDDELIAAATDDPEAEAILRGFALRSAMGVPIRKQDTIFGGIQFVMTNERRTYTEEDLTLAQAIGTRIASTLENRRLRQQRERTARTDAALARLGRRLAASASEEQVLAVIAEDAPDVLGASRAVVALARDANSLVLAGFGTGSNVAVLPLDGAGPVAQALLEADVVLREEPGWGPVEPEVGALVASPLYDDMHQTMGVLVLAWADPRSFDEVDRNVVETLSRLCGQAIVRSQLAGTTAAMADLAAAMATARTTTEVARLLREHGTEHLAAAVVNLRLVDRETASLLPVLPSELPEEIASRYERLSLGAVLPLTDAVRQNAPVWMQTLDDYRDRYEDVLEDTVAAGLGATAAVPLHDSDGTVVAAVAFAWPDAMRFPFRFRARLITLCDLAAQTLERVRLFEAEHAVVASMQRRLLTPLPKADGLELAAYYEPAAAAVGMGGDWYEAMVLADGSLVAIIGDVVGHGVGAVAAMAQIQHLLTGLIRADTPLGDVLAVANAMIAGPEPTYATTLLLHIDVAGERLGYSSAGHPWPLVRLPDGTIQHLDGNQHPMFGLDLPPSDLVYVPLPAGSLVVAYTDGLVERRGESIDASIDRLVRSMSGLEVDDDLELGLARLVEEVRGRDPEHRATSDDIAAIAIRSR